MGSTPAALASAKKALSDANKFTHSVTGGQSNPFKPSYKMVHTARQAATAAPPVAKTNSDDREFMGVRAGESNELNTALANRDQAQKALNQ